MWLQHRLKRLKTKWRNLHTYFRTLSEANEVERLTDLNRCERPVLLLYGFGATRMSVSILESRLRKDGFGVFSINLGGFLDLFNTSPIDQSAKMVAEKVESLCKRYHLPRLSIIGYSKGGLIGRYYISNLGGAKRVHTLITLATPHRGNPWTLLTGVFSKGLRQMIPASKFMRQLNKTPLPHDIYAVSIYSKLDKTSPPKYCQLPAATNGTPVHNVLLPHLYHSDFVIKRSAYQEIYKHLMAGLKNAENAQSEDEPQFLQRKAGY